MLTITAWSARLCRHDSERGATCLAVSVTPRFPAAAGRLDEAADIVGSLREVMPDVLVATDFDGTLAPIVVDPQQSRPVDGAIDALAALAAAGARVAVITGRDAGTVVRLGGLDRVPALTVAGL